MRGRPVGLEKDRCSQNLIRLDYFTVDTLLSLFNIIIIYQA